MVKKMLMGTVVKQILKDLSPDIPEEKQEEVENQISKKLSKVLGDNWVALPVSGPYMMIAVLILNYMLLPLGITPVKVADEILKKSREMEIDTKFSDLLLSAKGSAKATGEFTREKISELTEYSGEHTKEIKPKLKELLDSGQEMGKSVLNKGKQLGKGVFNSIRDKLDRDNDEEQLEEALE